MSDIAKKIESSVAALTAPLAGGDKGVGIDVSYDPQFERVKSEIDKISSMSSETPDWREVLGTSEQLLKEKSKDFRLVAWSTLARLHVSGLDGLAEGLGAMKGICEVYWDYMYPPVRRARARGNLADWLNEQVSKELQTLEPSAAQGDALKAVQSLSAELDTFLSDKLSDAYAGLGALRSLLRDKVRQLPADEPVPSQAPTATPSAGADRPVAPPASSPPNASATSLPATGGAIQVPETPDISAAGDILPALRTLGKGVVEVVRHMRRADPANAAAYRLQRAGIWLAVANAPPNEGGLTRIPPPSVDAKNKLTSRLQSAQWMDLLTTSEDLTSTYLFWFDLHRHVATAMDRLGALFIDARQIVGREVIGFLDRVPNTDKLCFSDGTPFADAGTQSWLDEERAKLTSHGSSESSSTRLSEEDLELAGRFEEAREMVNGGKVAEGLSLAVQLAMRGADARARFRSRIAVAQMALQGGQLEIGRPMLELLVTEAETRQLDDWEPQLCAVLYAAFLSCERSGGGKADRPESRRIFDRLCRLDPAMAIKFAGA